MAVSGGFSMSGLDLMRNMTMHITITEVREMRFRLWLAMQLMKVASWICGMGLEVTRRTKRIKQTPTRRGRKVKR